MNGLEDEFGKIEVALTDILPSITKFELIFPVNCVPCCLIPVIWCPVFYSVVVVFHRFVVGRCRVQSFRGWSLFHGLVIHRFRVERCHVPSFPGSVVVVFQGFVFHGYCGARDGRAVVNGGHG